MFKRATLVVSIIVLILFLILLQFASASLYGQPINRSLYGKLDVFFAFGGVCLISLITGLVASVKGYNVVGVFAIISCAVFFISLGLHYTAPRVISAVLQVAILSVQIRVLWKTMCDAPH